MDDHRRCLFVYVRLFDFPRGLGKRSKKWESRKIAAVTIATWEGSTSAERAVTNDVYALGVTPLRPAWSC